jgi:endoribonuclease L-PSP, putative
MKIAIQTKAAPQPIGSYTQGVQFENSLFTCQLGLDTAGNLAAPDVAAQTRQTLENIKAILKTAGMTMNDIVKTTLYLSDLADFSVVNDIYSQYFDSPYPARACIQAVRLPKEAKIEIEAIAIVRNH